MKNLFISIEGGEGSGKSTLVKRLAARYENSILVTREPGGSAYAEDIRAVALTHPLAAQASTETLLSLMFAARFDHVAKLIIPELAQRPVITDRFDMSSFAYQIYAEGRLDTPLERAFWDLRAALPVVPDVYVFLDVDPREGLRRRKEAKGSNHLDERPFDFHQKVSEGFKDFLARVPRSIVIDANEPLETVSSNFFTAIERELH